MIKVIDPGLSTTVQDLGRFGYYHIGMPPSGSMDNFSHSVANLLAGNDPSAATLEMTYVGGRYAFGGDTVIAITGADMQPRLNGQEIPMWASVGVKSGDVLDFGILKSGARSYLAIAGGIQVPLVMGSRSTYALCQIGGLEGRTLAKGDEVPTMRFKSANGRGSFLGRRIPSELVPKYSTTSELRMVVGLFSYRIEPSSLDEFFKETWVVTPEANRVGYRHRGIRLRFVDRIQPFGAGSNPSNVVDSGYPIGSVQVPDGAEPIVVLKDAITGGGYATIGTVISVDLDIVGQTRTNSVTHFLRISLEEALNARHGYKRRLAKVRAAIEEGAL